MAIRFKSLVKYSFENFAFEDSYFGSSDQHLSGYGGEMNNRFLSYKLEMIKYSHDLKTIKAKQALQFN